MTREHLASLLVAEAYPSDTVDEIRFGTKDPVNVLGPYRPIVPLYSTAVSLARSRVIADVCAGRKTIDD